MQLKGLIKETALKIVKDAQFNLKQRQHNVSGSLYSSLTKYDIKQTKNGFQIIFNFNDYGNFLDKGVKGSKGVKDGVKRGGKTYYFTEDTPYRFKNRMPPVKVIKEWVKNKPIRARNKRGAFVKMNPDSLAYIIARSIKEKGIPQTRFFSEAFEKNSKLLEAKIENYINNLNI